MEPKQVHEEGDVSERFLESGRVLTRKMVLLMVLTKSISVLQQSEHP